MYVAQIWNAVACDAKIEPMSVRLCRLYQRSESTVMHMRQSERMCSVDGEWMTTRAVFLDFTRS